MSTISSFHHYKNTQVFDFSLHCHKMTSSDNLFKPLKVGRINLDHRVAMAPLTRLRAMDHQVKDIHTTYYGQRASTPGTLLITEATLISEAASGEPDAPGIYKPEHIAGWQKVVNTVHEKGSYLYVQLWAIGRMASPDDLKSRGLPYVAPSAVKIDPADEHVPTPLTKSEIKQYVADYVQAAKNAIEAGADGVEIHSANGYLLDQFLHENSNTRTDEYGGSIENRARFTLEVVDAVSAAIGADRTGIRFAPWGLYGGMEPGVSPIPQFSYVLAELQKRALAGKELAYVHLLEPRWVLRKGFDDVVYVEGSNDFARTIYTGVLIRSNGYNVESAKADTGKDDKLLIAVGRYFISTPDLVNRWKNGIPLNPYQRETFYASGKEGYIDYPFAEDEVAITTA